MESVRYRETYRDPERDGEGFKRILMTIVLRSQSGTLTGEQAEAARNAICEAVRQTHDGRLLT